LAGDAAQLGGALADDHLGVVRSSAIESGLSQANRV
jgi:hypothetical protein